MYNVLMLLWDSDFFGFPVGNIDTPNMSAEELGEALADLKSAGARLVYWAADLSFESKRAALLYGGLHVDRKTIFKMKSNVVVSRIPDLSCIEEYFGPPTEETNSLAVQCGHYSRFNIDPYMPADSGKRMYVEWMNNSISRDLAKTVFVAKKDDKICGIITLGDRNGVGDIGLLSVDYEARGNQYGSLLVQAAQKWFVKNEYKDLQVVTQGNNIAACKLYEKNLYKPETVYDFYHFWIGE